jgi:hypothetical protein
LTLALTERGGDKGPRQGRGRGNGSLRGPRGRVRRGQEAGPGRREAPGNPNLLVTLTLTLLPNPHPHPHLCINSDIQQLCCQEEEKKPEEDENKDENKDKDEDTEEALEEDEDTEKKLRQLVYEAPSNIPGAGRGLFANTYLRPGNANPALNPQANLRPNLLGLSLGLYGTKVIAGAAAEAILAVF